MSRPRSEGEKNAAKFPPTKTIAEQILTNAQDSRPVVQDFVPLAESLEWELGQEYLRARGNKAFISDASPVPFVVNNDGNLSRNAAEVFFTSLLEAEKAGELEPDIYVLELGIGVGLFARFFLDHFQQLCDKQRKDYYDRLIYVAADRSERMLTDVIRHGVLTNHPGRYRLRVVDAMCPEKDLPFDVAFADHPRKERPFRAVFLNYLLDCLPASMLQFDGNEVKQLHVRTCVARNVNLEDFTDMTVDQLKERAKSNEPAAKQELLEVFGLFASEYDHRPVDASKIPYSKFAVECYSSLVDRYLLARRNGLEAKENDTQRQALLAHGGGGGIACFASEEAEDYVIRELESDDPERQLIGRHLAEKFGTERMLTLLVAHWPVQGYYVPTPHEFGKRLGPERWLSLWSQSPLMNVKVALIEIACDLRDPRIEDTLIGGLADPAIAGKCAQSLSAMGSDRACPAIRQLLTSDYEDKNKRDWNRYMAFRALAVLRDPSCVEELVSFAESDDGVKVYEGTSGLASIGTSTKRFFGF